MRVPFLDLRALNQPLLGQYEEAYRRNITQCDFILGGDVARFETAFAQWVEPGAQVVSCANGTDAITLAAKALELPDGAEVIAPAMTYYATISALLQAGLKVRLVDVANDTGLLDTTQLQKVITPKTALIVPVHFFGQMCPMDEVRRIADQNQCYVLEDAAQAHGAKWKEKAVGHWGHVASYSFYPGKNLGCFGDGGAILTHDPKVTERAKNLRNHGSIEKYVHTRVGFNSRLDTVQAGVLNVKLNHIDQWNTRRREVANAYREMLTGIAGLTLPVESPQSKHVYHLYVVRVQQRDAFMAHLKANEVDCGIHYPKAIHEHESFKGMFEGSFPNAEALARECVSLPMCPTLSDVQVAFVGETIRKFFR